MSTLITPSGRTKKATVYTKLLIAGLRGSSEESCRPPRVPETTTEEPGTATPVESDPIKPEVVGQQLVNGTEKRSQAELTLAANETGLVTAWVPVDYETFIQNPELWLSVSFPDETTTSTAST